MMEYRLKARKKKTCWWILSKHRSWLPQKL